MESKRVLRKASLERLVRLHHIIEPAIMTDPIGTRVELPHWARFFLDRMKATKDGYYVAFDSELSRDRLLRKYEASSRYGRTTARALPR